MMYKLIIISFLRGPNRCPVISYSSEYCAFLNAWIRKQATPNFRTQDYSCPQLE